MLRLGSVAAETSLRWTMKVVSSGASTEAMFSTVKYQLSSGMLMARSKENTQSSPVTGVPSEKHRPSLRLKV